MGRPSGNPDKAVGGSAFSTVEAGKYEVVAASFKVHKGDFAESVPTLSRVLSLVHLDSTGKMVKDADPLELIQSCGGSFKNSEGNKTSFLTLMRPGNGKGPDDVDPEDLGDAVDTEGNTVYCEDDPRAQFNKSTTFTIFNTSLAANGFSKEILDRCWAPDLVGLQFELIVLQPKEINDRFGTRLDTRPSTLKNSKTGEPVVTTYKVVDKWLNPNYLSDKSEKTAASASAKAATNGHGKISAEDAAKAVMAKVAEINKGKKLTFNVLNGQFISNYQKMKQPTDKLADAKTWVKANLAEAVGAVDGSVEDDGTIVFSE